MSSKIIRGAALPITEQWLVVPNDFAHGDITHGDAQGREERGHEELRIPSDVDQHSELMSITIPK